MRTRTLLSLVVLVVAAGAGRSGAQSGPPPLRPDDMIEIEQLYAKYAWAIDAGDAEGYASTFTPDGVFNTNVGHDALAKFATTFHAGMGSHVRHWNSSLVITPTPTGASGQVYLMIVDVATTPATIVRVGSYTDELVRTAQGWRFTKRATIWPVAPTKQP